MIWDATDLADRVSLEVRNWDRPPTVLRRRQESLEHQTASAEVLGHISSSPGTLKPVFQAMLAKAMQICEEQCGAMFALDGEQWCLTSSLGGKPEFVAFLSEPRVCGPATGLGRVIQTLRPVHIDSKVDSAFIGQDQGRLAAVNLGEVGAFVIVPMLKEGRLIGAMSLWREAVRPFRDQQIELVTTFAKQAVMAIENARLFEEVQARTHELQTALQRQTATSDVLNVISRSPTDARPVFEIIGERAEKLCAAEISVVSILDGDLIQLAGIHGISPCEVELFRAHFPMPLQRETVTARTIKSGAVIEVTDVLADTSYDNKALARDTGYRSCLGVPMHRKGEVVGAIFVARTEPGDR